MLSQILLSKIKLFYVISTKETRATATDEVNHTSRSRDVIYTINHFNSLESCCSIAVDFRQWCILNFYMTLVFYPFKSDSKPKNTANAQFTHSKKKLRIVN